MGNIYVGTGKLKNVYISTSKVKKIYVGTEAMWQSAIPIARPTSAQLNPSGTYSGSAISNGFSMTGVEYVSGTTSGTNAGTYVAYYQPDEEHIWEDTEDRAQVTVTLTITRASVGAKPSAPSAVTWNGGTYYAWSSVPTGVTSSGTNSASAAGTYSVSFTPQSNYMWSDGTQDTVTFSWTINRASVGSKPTNKSYDYSGSAKTAYSYSYVSTSGTNSATNGGTYSCTYTPDSNHKWSDGTYSSVSITWYIYYVWSKYYATLYYSKQTTALSGGTWNNAVMNYGGVDGYVANSDTGVTSSASLNTSTGYYTQSISGGYLVSAMKGCYRYWSNCTCVMTSTEFSNKKWKQMVCGATVMWWDDFQCWVGASTLYGTSSSYVRGSYITQVRSTSTGSYPSNARASDGYWYVRTA